MTAAGMRLVDEFDVLWIDLVGAQRLVEEHVRGGAGRGCDSLSLEIGERFDAWSERTQSWAVATSMSLIKKYLALSARRKVREHGAGREHVEAAADHRLEEFEAGVELA